MERRAFLLQLAAALGALAGSRPLAAAARPPRLLLRSSWQTVNIGDIAHTPGVLHLLEEFLPEAEVRLWPGRLDHGVDELLRERFPSLRIAQDAEALRAAFDECDFLLHGSGPSLSAKDVAKWRAATGKPYGIYGITYSSTEPESLDLLSGARFVFFRDSVSLQWARDHGCQCPVMEFGPDGAFAVDLRDDRAAEAFLAAHHLEPGKFLCCIPRLRNTPYWTLPEKKVAFNAHLHARNEAMKEHDHAPLRQAIVDVIRQTDLKILLCPEDETQMKVGRELLFDPLPEDVKARVVWRETFWLTGEAVSTYVRSAGLFGLEMHSPIMCIGQGVPAIVCRWKEQSSKGLMWRDIGLGDWLFDLDDEGDVAKVAPAVLALAQNPAAAKAKAAQALAFVRQRQRESIAVVKRCWPA